MMRTPRTRNGRASQPAKIAPNKKTGSAQKPRQAIPDDAKLASRKEDQPGSVADTEEEALKKQFYANDSLGG